MTRKVDPARYDAEYFEAGLVSGISGYMNYSWMPEPTLRMAHKFCVSFPIRAGQRVLDFGCAKGYLVKALRILDVDAHGVDVSSYAIERVDREVSAYCRRISGCADETLFEGTFDWMIAKDVLEHNAEEELRPFLERATRHVRKAFVAVPLAADDDSGVFVVPEYNRDVTHVLAKSLGWWKRLFDATGWQIDAATHGFSGCKENWSRYWKEGNGFLLLSSKRGTP